MREARILDTPASAHVRAQDGELLPLRIWMPRGKPRRAIVALHGMVTHSGWFARLAELLVEEGVALVAPDRRGNGLLRESSRAGDVDLLIADVEVVVDSAHELSDDITLFSWCGSANFAVPSAARVRAQRFVLASPGLVPLEEMSRRFRTNAPIDGFLPIHFDPSGDFTDDAEARAMIRADELYLRRIPVEVRDAWRKLNPLARALIHQLPIPACCVLTRVDRMIDIQKTVDLLGDLPVHWTEGGHGFVVESAGARFMAQLLAEGA